jgi:hypothetical protein
MVTDIRIEVGIVAGAALAGRVLPLVRIGGQPLHDGGLVGVFGLHAVEHGEPRLLALEPLFVARGGAGHQRRDGRADDLFLCVCEAPVDQARIRHHLLEAGLQALVGIALQVALLVFLVGLAKLLAHVRDLRRRNGQQDVGDVGLGVLEGVTAQRVVGGLVGAHLLGAHRLLQLVLGAFEQDGDAWQLLAPVPRKEAGDGAARGVDLRVLHVEVAVDPPVDQPVALLVAELHGAAGGEDRHRAHDQPTRQPARPAHLRNLATVWWVPWGAGAHVKIFGLCLIRRKRASQKASQAVQPP